MSRILAGAAFSAVLLLATTMTAQPAGADSSGSSSSHVVGRGDIVTTILTNSKKRRTNGSGVTPTCIRHTFSDAQIEFLVALIAHFPDAPVLQHLITLMRDYLADSGDPSDSMANGASYEIRARICDGVMVSAEAVARTSPLEIQSVLGRKMITHLPEPTPLQSPPLGTSVPVEEPVFVSIAQQQWAPIEATLRVGAVVADVRAKPIALRLYTGEPHADFQICQGRGRPFDRSDTASPEAQASRPESCVMRYQRVSSRLGAWLGTITVSWSAEWRTNNGPWRSLGIIPRTTVIERQSREVITAIGGLG